MDNNHLTQEEALDLDEIKTLIDMPVSENGAGLPPEPEQAPPGPDTPGESPEGKPQKKNPLSIQKNFVLYLHDLAYLMVAIVMVFLLFFRIVVVSGDSMYDTLVDGDYLLLLSNVFYQEPEAGDVIVISKDDYDNGMPIVKRVIATEGQVVDIDFVTGTVTVDGEVLEEDYIFTRTTLDEGVAFPHTVEDGCVFVLGDNRGRSKDSRNPEIGDIDCRQVVGKVILLVLPGTDEGNLKRDFKRIGGIG